VKAIAALAPVAQDIVLAGHDRSEVGFPGVPQCRGLRALVPSLPSDAPLDLVLGSEPVRARVREGLVGLRNESSGSSVHGNRALLLVEPPSIDRGEITDKGT
jgi:feruloyl-CoA synthase